MDKNAVLTVDAAILKKWEVLIEACKAYYIDCIPTGLTDAEYDEMEAEAAKEEFYVRDYVFQKYLTGVKTLNKYIEKIKKEKVSGKMLDSIKKFEKDYGKPVYTTLKYDGSSIAIYIDPTNGVPRRISTVGNLNINDYGVDQTTKLIDFVPKQFPLGIVAVQCEALIDINRFSDGDPDRARQKVNGLINSKYCDSEVNSLLTLRMYRYYTDDSYYGREIKAKDYRDVLSSIKSVVSPIDGHTLFAPAQVWTVDELGEWVENDKTQTNTGKFLNDGIVLYSTSGECIKALKYAGAGSGTEAIKTKVQSIQWNDQTSKGKDSWSANVIVDPVVVKGVTIKKPSAGSVSKLVKNNITPGATIGIILANSTIPMVGETFSPGNGDYMWPKCDCGYQMSDKDVFGSLLKCGNPMCTRRIGRMADYLASLKDIHKDIDLNKLLVIDRFKWENTDISTDKLLSYVENNDETEYHNYLSSYMTTNLQKKNMGLVWKASFIVLRKFYEGLTK